MVIAHGLDIPPDPASYRGFEYLASHLASRGFISATAAMHGLGEDVSSPRRLALLVEHVAALLRRPTSDRVLTELRGRVDPDNVGLVGHSMSGQAAASAARELSCVRAVAALAPSPLGTGSGTDSTAPFLMIQWTRDGIVAYGRGYGIDDRASRPKYLVNVYGANHVQFSTAGVDPRTDSPATITGDQQRVLTKAFVTAFLASHLEGAEAYSELFDTHTVVPSVGSVPTTLVFSNLPRSSLSWVVDDAQDAAGSAGTNSLGRTNRSTGTTDFVQESLRRASEPTFNFYTHDTDGLRVAWRARGASVTFELPERDVRIFEFLSFRVAQRFRATGNLNREGAVIDLLVRLSDSRGGTSFPVATRLYGWIPYPDTIGEYFTKSVMQTVRIPVRVFSANRSPLDRRHVTSVSFSFLAPGELIFDDVEFIGIDPTVIADPARP